jgi:hypothetical protein
MKRTSKTLKSIDVSNLAEVAGGQECPNGICPPPPLPSDDYPYKYAQTSPPAQTWGQWFSSWF